MCLYCIGLLCRMFDMCTTITRLNKINRKYKCKVLVFKKERKKREVDCKSKLFFCVFILACELSR